MDYLLEQVETDTKEEIKKIARQFADLIDERESNFGSDS